jgi:hypothetical protein
MAAYRFKICLEDNEDVYRDIEIKAIQNFEDFHKIIQEAYKFDAKHAASFFVSDDYWRKGQEITLRKEDLPLDEEEILKKVGPKKLMADVKIAKYIDQPHQRFIYVFDPVVQWSFLIEMMRIIEVNPKSNYPLIIKSAGLAPKQYKQINMAKEELSAEMAIAGLLNEIEDPDDDEILKNISEVEEGIEDDDLVSLEGEEGEEEETAEDDLDDDTNAVGFDEEHDDH